MKKFVSLLSGGLDSPIAAYLMIKKGFQPIFLSFLTSDTAEHSLKEKIIQIVKRLKELTKVNQKIYFINHDQNLELFKELCERKLTCVLCKRLMIRIAQEIGKKEETNIIVTGDILGEQASQTLDNLYIYNNIMKNYIILRPLIGWNKENVIELNQKIGLYEVVSAPSSSCEYNPQYPETHAKFSEVIKSESNVQIDQLIAASIQRAEILNF